MAIRLEEFNKNQRVYNRNQNTSKITEVVEGKDNNYYIPNKGIVSKDEVPQYTNSQDNQPVQYLIKGNDSYYRDKGAEKSNHFSRVKRILLRGKFLYFLITIVLFLLTPFLITISMTGIIEGNISDTLTEVRRVNVKYKSGSQSMDISKFMVGVLATRLSMSKEPEVLKAESVMVRTEIYRCMGDEMSIDSTNLNLDYISDKEMKSLWGDAYTENYNLIVDSISATSGLLISYNSQLIEPMYHEISAGKTRNGKQVFADSPGDYSYLNSVNCEHDVEAPNYLAIKNFSYDEFVKAFNQKYSDINISKENPAQSLQIVSRCSADYVLKIQVGNVLMTGEEFAKALNLNSSCFWIESSSNSLKITTKGKGNGLGVSIYTADNMAKSGSSFQDILNKFYSNITIMSE